MLWPMNRAPFLALALALPLLAAVRADAARPEPPRLEVIAVPGSDAEYLVDRQRDLCFFRSGQALTPVDCARVLGTTPAPAAPKPRDLGKGATLSVDVRPWAQVTIDGVDVGAPPLEVAVGPGEHVVRVVRGASTLERRVTVRRGETWSVSARLDDERPALFAGRTKPQRRLGDLGKGARLVLLAWPRVDMVVDGGPSCASPCIVDVAPGVHTVAAPGMGPVYLDLGLGDEARVDARGARGDEPAGLDVVHLRADGAQGGPEAPR